VIEAAQDDVIFDGCIVVWKRKCKNRYIPRHSSCCSTVWC